MKCASRQRCGAITSATGLPATIQGSGQREREHSVLPLTWRRSEHSILSMPIPARRWCKQIGDTRRADQHSVSLRDTQVANYRSREDHPTQKRSGLSPRSALPWRRMGRPLSCSPTSALLNSRCVAKWQVRDSVECAFRPGGSPDAPESTRTIDSDRQGRRLLCLRRNVAAAPRGKLATKLIQAGRPER